MKKLSVIIVFLLILLIPVMCFAQAGDHARANAEIYAIRNKNNNITVVYKSCKRTVRVRRCKRRPSRVDRAYGYPRNLNKVYGYPSVNKVYGYPSLRSRPPKLHRKRTKRYYK